MVLATSVFIPKLGFLHNVTPTFHYVQNIHTSFSQFGQGKEQTLGLHIKTKNAKRNIIINYQPFY